MAFHSVIGGFVAAMAAAAVLCHYQLYWWLMTLLLYIIILSIRGVCTMRHSRLELRESYFVVHTGAFAEISNFVAYRDVEVVRLRRTP